MLGLALAKALRWAGPTPTCPHAENRHRRVATSRPFALGDGRGTSRKGAAVSDRRKPNRNAQRRARTLVAERGITYMQAVSMIRNEPTSTGSTSLEIFTEQCENILGRRGIVSGMHSKRPSRARLIADAFAHARGLLASRVRELAPGEPIVPVADAAKMLAGAALAAADPRCQIVTPQQLVELVRESPSQIAWAGLPSSRPGADRALEDTREWWSRVRDTLPGVGDLEAADSHTLHVLLRLLAEYAFWCETGVADLP